MPERESGRKAVIALALLTATACAGYREREADRAYQAGDAVVERVEVMVDEVSRQMTATIYGTLPDACTELDRVDRNRFGSQIDVRVTTRSAPGAECTPDPRPFEKTWFMTVADLPPGLYTVNVNGATATFHLVRGFPSPEGSPFETPNTP